MLSIFTMINNTICRSLGSKSEEEPVNTILDVFAEVAPPVEDNPFLYLGQSMESFCDLSYTHKDPFPCNSQDSQAKASPTDECYSYDVCYNDNKTSSLMSIQSSVQSPVTKCTEKIYNPSTTSNNNDFGDKSFSIIDTADIPALHNPYADDYSESGDEDSGWFNNVRHDRERKDRHPPGRANIAVNPIPFSLSTLDHCSDEQDDSSGLLATNRRIRAFFNMQPVSSPDTIIPSETETVQAPHSLLLTNSTDIGALKKLADDIGIAAYIVDESNFSTSEATATKPGDVLLTSKRQSTNKKEKGETMVL